MASESSGSSRVVLAVAALAAGVVIGILVKGGGSGGGTPFTCDSPGDHLITVFPGKLSCASVTVSTSANNGISWQASDRNLVLQIDFNSPAPFPVYCSGPYCVAGPFDPNLPSGNHEFGYRASAKLPTQPPPDPRTPTPTPGVLTGRVIIVKP